MQAVLTRLRCRLSPAMKLSESSSTTAWKDAAPYKRSDSDIRQTREWYPQGTLPLPRRLFLTMSILRKLLKLAEQDTPNGKNI